MPNNLKNKKSFLQQEDINKVEYAELQPIIVAFTKDVLAWPEVEKHKYVYGGEEFRLFNRSIGHIHSNGFLDLPFVKDLRVILLEQRCAELHHVHKSTTWICKRIQSIEDIETAKSLLLLSYWVKGNDYFYRSENAKEFIMKNLSACKFSPSIFAAANFQTGGVISPNK